MQHGHKIEKFEKINIFKEKLEHYDEIDVECTLHTFFRLSGKQREIFTCDIVKELLFHQTPVKVGIQYNQNYAAFYEHEKQRILKVVISFRLNKVNIVTFYILDSRQLPR